MLSATLLALTAAVLHAGWNFAVKQSTYDRFISLWAQFLLGGLVAGMLLIVTVLATSPPAAATWGWAALSGVVHMPYLVLLSRAYSYGDFSQVYPIARGGGALLAAFGGIVLLGDDVSALGIVAILVLCSGVLLLAGRWDDRGVCSALGVALTIGAYTLFDSKGARSSSRLTYGLITGVTTMMSATVYGVSTRRVAELRTALRNNWRRFLVAGLASLLTYSLVLIAVRSAPVGYVAAIRESSVLIAALIGWRVLGEGQARRRLAASALMLVGLVLLVTAG